MNNKTDIAHKDITQYILYIRNRKVILDTDLANIYEVQTKRLNEQVKRNIGRFPEDFMFRLTDKELEEVVAKCDHLKNLKFTSINPNAFTEYGALMVSSILKSPRAIETSIFIVRAFVKLREILASHENLERRFSELEDKYDKNFLLVFKALQQLIREEEKPRKKIGFKTGEEKAK